MRERTILLGLRTLLTMRVRLIRLMPTTRNTTEKPGRSTGISSNRSAFRPERDTTLAGGTPALMATLSSTVRSNALTGMRSTVPAP